MSYKLDFNGELDVKNNSTFQKNVSVDSLTVANDSTFQKKLTVSGDLVTNKMTVTDSATTITNKLDLTQSILNNALSSNLQDLIIQTVYPVGSLYISTVDIEGEKIISLGVPTVIWHGCRWTPYTCERFIKGRSVIVNGSTWSFNYEDETGGSATHNHTLSSAIAHVFIGAVYGSVYFRQVNGPSFTSNFHTAGLGNNTTITSDQSSEAGVSLGGSTDAASNLPPYTNCYIYKRFQ